MTSIFFLGVSPSSYIFSRSSTCSFSFSPKMLFGVSENASIREAIEHLFARNREIRPKMHRKCIYTFYISFSDKCQLTENLIVTFTIVTLLTLVLRRCTSNKRGVKKQSVLWRISLRFQRSEECFFGTENLNRTGRILGELGQTTGMRDESCTHHVANETSQRWRYVRHLVRQVALEVLAIVSKFDNLKFLIQYFGTNF